MHWNAERGGMTSLASSDGMMILASAHIQMPRVSMDKYQSDPNYTLYKSCAMKALNHKLSL